MKLLSADDTREFINQRKPTTPEELKEALTIKDLGSRSFSRGSRSNSRLCLFKKSDADAIKNLWLTKRKAESIWFVC